jgi:hypothetical protein
LISPLDGVPLDNPLKAVLIGLVLPALWWFHPTFLRTRRARRLITGLLVWKIAANVLFVQGGWCAQFITPFSAVPSGSVIQQSWDLRTGWQQPPTCSAIMARDYRTAADFPLWFANLFDDAGRPPNAVITMKISGLLTVPAPGNFMLAVGQDMGVQGIIGTSALPAARGPRSVHLERGTHPITLAVTLAGRPSFVPAWNGRQLWRGDALATTTPPRSWDRWIHKPASLVTPGLMLALIGSWLLSALAVYQPNRALLAWTAGASVLLSLAPGHGALERIAVALLFGSLLVPAAASLRNLRGGMLLLGVPWLSFFVTKSWHQIGRFTLYSSPRDDWLTFQRFAHRIFMEGYWLEAGEKTFWKQPLYRWTVGVLHLIFGDSSVGEVYWDAGALLIGALFCLTIVKGVGGFRWGLAAGATTLLTWTLGPIWYLIGRGLSEISATGWAYLAAFCLLRARLGRWSWALAAGGFAVLMFYTRLNHLLFAVALVMLLLPLSVLSRVGDAVRGMQRISSWRLPLVYLACVLASVALFALRTWYYTGIFSVLYKSQRELLSTGLEPQTLLSVDAWKRALGSMWMVMTVHDPAHLNLRGAFVTFGVVCAMLSLLQVPLFRRLPLSLSVACAGAIVASVFVRGSAYPGRFSVHVVPVAIALAYWMIIMVQQIVHRQWVGQAADAPTASLSGGRKAKPPCGQ